MRRKRKRKRCERKRVNMNNHGEIRVINDVLDIEKNRKECSGLLVHHSLWWLASQSITPVNTKTFQLNYIHNKFMNYS